MDLRQPLLALVLLGALGAQEPDPPGPDAGPGRGERPDKAKLTFSEEAARILKEFSEARHDLLAAGLQSLACEVTLHSDRLGVGRIKARYSWTAPEAEEIAFPEGQTPLAGVLRQGLKGLWRDLVGDPLGETLKAGGHLEVSAEEGRVLLLERGKRTAARLVFDPATRLLTRIEGEPKTETRFAYERVQDKWSLSGRSLVRSEQDRQGLALVYSGFKRLNRFTLPSLVKLSLRGEEHELGLEILTLNGAPALAVVADPKAFKAAIGAFQAGWTHWNPVQKVEEAGKLAALGGPEAALALASKLTDPSPLVRMELAAALGRMKERGTVPALLSALDRERKEVQVLKAVCRALGEIGDPKAVEPLARNIFSGDRREEEWQEGAKERIDAIGSIRHPAAVEELIALLGKCGGVGRRGGGGGGYGQFHQIVQRTLRRLTGVDLRDQNEWRSWWKENKAGFRFP